MGVTTHTTEGLRAYRIRRPEWGRVRGDDRWDDCNRTRKAALYAAKKYRMMMNGQERKVRCSGNCLRLYDPILSTIAILTTALATRPTCAYCDKLNVHQSRWTQAGRGGNAWSGLRLFVRSSFTMGELFQAVPCYFPSHFVPPYFK